jgi:hypothetical protein
MRCLFEIYRTLDEDAHPPQAIERDGKLSVPVLATGGGAQTLARNGTLGWRPGGFGLRDASRMRCWLAWNSIAKVALLPLLRCDSVRSAAGTLAAPRK